MTTDNLPTAGKVKPVVLSYNICFQSMENAKHGTAKALGKKCDQIAPIIPGEKFTKCAANMARSIDSFPNSLSVKGYDFVGLQEANRARSLSKATSNTLDKMGSFYSENTFKEWDPRKNKMVDRTVFMASFYDTAKYNKVYEYGGHFARYDDDGNTIEEQPARLFHILVFKNKFDASGTIFINVHSPHGYSFKEMESCFTPEIKKFNLSETEKTYRIIAVGDFNETGLGMSPTDMTWAPFAEIPTTLEIKNVVNSCSFNGDGVWADSSGHLDLSQARPGDYIFDSEQPAKIGIPSNYDPTLLQSDHLPVISELV